MKSNLGDRILTFVLITVAIIVGANALRGRSAAKPPNLVREAQRSSQFKNWRGIDSSGYVVYGAANSPVSVAVFADLQCPSCRGFHRMLMDAASRNNGNVKIVYVNYPLDYHEHALSGARATHCVATANGDMIKWFDTVFTKQDSIGKISWPAFALLAGVSDTAAIAACSAANSSAAVAAVRKSQAWGRQIEIDGTPTVLVNGHKLIRTPSADQLDTIIRYFARRL